LASLNDSKDELVHKIHLSKTKTKKRKALSLIIKEMNTLSMQNGKQKKRTKQAAL
jgi:hypothetical protein